MFQDMPLLLGVPVLMLLLILPSALILVIRNSLQGHRQLREQRENKQRETSDEQLRKIAAEYLKKADEEKAQNPEPENPAPNR